MGTLTPEAFAKLYGEMVEAARKAGWPGMKNSPEFIQRINLEYDRQFGGPASKFGHADGSN